MQVIIYILDKKRKSIVRSCSGSRPFVDRRSGLGTTNILCRPIGQTSRYLFIPFICRQRISPRVADLRFVDRRSGLGTTNILCRPIGQTSRYLFIPFICRQRISPRVADLRFRLAPPERAPWARTCDPSVSSSKRKFKKSLENIHFAL